MNIFSKFLIIANFLIISGVTAQTLEKNVKIAAPSYGAVADHIRADIWLPKGYNKNSPRKHRWLIFLHGAGDAGGKEFISRVISNSFEMYPNAIDPPVVVMPNVFSFRSPSFGNRHLYANSEWHGKCETIITEDILAYLKSDTEFNLSKKLSFKKEHMGIGGFSMGGDGALRIALRNPEMFQVALVHSSIASLSDEVINYFTTGAIAESCKSKPCDYSTGTPDKDFTTKLMAASSAWGALDQNGDIRFILDNQGKLNDDVLDEWRMNYQPSSLIESQNLYKTRPGPYLYLETGSEDEAYFTLFPQFVKQLNELQVPTDSYKWVTSIGGHRFDETRAIDALKYALEKMEDISTSTKNYADEFNYSVNPNPVHHAETWLTFDLPSTPVQARLVVTNIQGEILNTKALKPMKSQSQININVAHLSPGIYLFQLQIDEKQAVKKVIIY